MANVFIVVDLEGERDTDTNTRLEAANQMLLLLL